MVIKNSINCGYIIINRKLFENERVYPLYVNSFPPAVLNNVECELIYKNLRKKQEF